MLQPRTQSFYQYFILLLAVVLIGLISLLTILHKPSTEPLSAVTMFPQARELEPFQLSFYSPDATKPFTQQAFAHHWTILFFGFTHCADVCPAALSLLREIYPQLRTQHPELQVIFVSIDPRHDHPEHLKSYVIAVNKDFIATTGTEKELKKLQGQFGVFAEKGMSSGSSLSHTSSLFLINPQGQWVALVSSNIPANRLRHQLEKILPT